MKDVELQLMAFGEQISVGALYTTLKHYFQFGTFVASQYAVMLGNLQSSDRFFLAYWSVIDIKNNFLYFGKEILNF